MLGDGQPEAGSAVFPRGGAVRLLEGLEETPLGLRRNADARVLDLEAEQQGGVIGLTDENSVSSSKPGKLRFGDSLEVGAREAEKLRKQGADLIVVVAHAGRDRDEALFSAGFADVILSGHDHDLYMRFNEKTAIVEAGEDGMAVVAVDVKVSVGQDRNGRRQVRWWA